MRYITNSFDRIDKDELFDESTVLEGVLELIDARKADITAVVSEEWERKDEVVRSPLNERSGQDSRSTLIVSVEIRIEAWDRRNSPQVQTIESAVATVLEGREQERKEAELAEVEADRAAKAAEVKTLEERIAKLNQELQR